MKFCIQRSLAQPGKHAKFQQGCRGRKAKGGKAIKTRDQNFQKSFFQLFCVCIAPIFMDIMPNIADAMQIANCVSWLFLGLGMRKLLHFRVHSDIACIPEIFFRCC